MTGFRKIKAYTVTENDSGVYFLVYAASASKARYIAYGFCDDVFDGAYYNFKDFLDCTTVRREKDMDGFYRGKDILDWYDSEDRIALVKTLGWHCFDYGCNAEDYGCRNCAALQYCDFGKELLEEDGKGNDWI